MTLFLIILGLILFVGLILAHEWGHFKAARRNDVDVEEFGLGFPPRVWGKKLKSGMLLSINVLPIGGFVKLKGEHDSDTGKGTYGAAKLSAKVKIMLAGVGMNLVIAIGLLTAVAVMGMPQILDNQFNVESDSRITKQMILVSDVEPDSPAFKAGIREGETISSIGPVGNPTQVSIKEPTELRAATESLLSGGLTELELSTNNKTVKVVPRSLEEVAASENTDQPKGYLGILPAAYVVKRSTWSAPIVAVGVTGQVIKETMRGVGVALGSLLRGDTKTASDQASGPVGIFFLMKWGSQLGLELLLLIVALISLTLAIMNFLPIPALDGGRLFVTLLFRALKKPLTPKLEERIHGTGFAVLMVLFILITIVDVKRFF